MAQRRMFSKKITDTDLFLDMPLSTQCLYFHLNMNADDEGFVSSIKKIQRMIGASDDDLKILLTKQFLIPFESGIVVIKDWKIHNYIQKDRFQATVYVDEKRLLSTDETGSYTTCIQNVSSSDTQVRLGKDRLGKVSKEYIVEPKADNVPYKIIIDYLNQKANTNFKASSKATQTKIKARLAEGFGVDDFKKVIDNKCTEWLNDADMSKYLRPETLFSPKFEGYLNQKELSIKPKKQWQQSTRKETLPDWAQEDYQVPVERVDGGTEEERQKAWEVLNNLE